MSQAAFRVNGVDLLADASGALWWPARRTAVVADLHLEKGSAFARWGQLLPPYDTRATLDRLQTALDRLQPVQVICLGDSFQDGNAEDRISVPDSTRIASLTSAFDWIWVTGNHDPRPPTAWGGRVEAAVTLGSLLFRHEADSQAGAGEVSGHYHPKAAVHVRAKRVSRRCFVSDGRRAILPAFGAYAGGLNVLHPRISGLFEPGFTVHMLGRDRIFMLPAGRLEPEGDFRGAEPAYTRRTSFFAK